MKAEVIHDGGASVVDKSMRGASFLASMQLLSRLFTFFLNTTLAAYMQDMSAFGVSSVQLYLYYITALTLSREGIRRTCLRTAIPKNQSIVPMVNLIWWGVALGCFVVTPCILSLFLWYANPAMLGSLSLDEYRTALHTVTIAIVLESLCEPLFVSAQGCLLYELRTKIEALGVILRAICTFTCVVVFKMKFIAFALGHVAYASTLLIMYLRWAVSIKSTGESRDGIWDVTSWKSLIPSDGMRVKNLEYIKVALSMSGQTVFKLLLAEGEKFVMILLQIEASDQAVYAVVFNLGALVARFVFQPIEESAFAIFGKLHDMQKQNPTQDIGISRLLMTFCKSMTLVGLVFVAFGPHYTHFLLRTLYGRKLSDDTPASEALGWYCVYVLILGVNGITEACVHATADEKTLSKFNLWMGLFSSLYLGSAYFLLRFGTTGLIFANCINMFARILFSLNYLKGAHYVRSVFDLFPRVVTWALFAITFTLLFVSKQYIYKDFISYSTALIHVGLGGCCLLVVGGAVVFKLEPELAQSFREMLSPESESKKQS